MAAAVLLIMFIKGIMHLAVLMMAYAQGEPAMALAIIITTCCGASKALKKMKQQQQQTEKLPLQTPKEEPRVSAPLLPTPRVSFQTSGSENRFL